MKVPGFFDIDRRLEALSCMGDPLEKLNEVIPWEEFRPLLSKVHEKARKSNAGRKPLDVILMFKILILQNLYNLVDNKTEYLIRDRLSFMRFLGLELKDTIPDEKTIWLFRERLKELDLSEKLFAQFSQH